MRRCSASFRRSVVEVHPELRRVARFLPQQVVRPSTLRVVRTVTALQFRRTPPEVETRTLPTGVPLRLYRPSASAVPGPALLWMHGGGYVFGVAAQDDRLCRQFANTLGVLVASVDYRLAPEYPYPAALQDCVDSLDWVAALPEVDSGRIAVAGASAGAGLAARLALRTRERSDVNLVAQVLAYPMLDDRTSALARRSKPGQRMWNLAANRFGWTSYLADADPRDAAPARHTDLSGLPPAWIGIGTQDIFYEEAIDYAHRLFEAGTPCELDVIPGAFHGFDLAVPKAVVSRAFFASQCAALVKAFRLGERI